MIILFWDFRRIYLYIYILAFSIFPSLSPTHTFVNLSFPIFTFRFWYSNIVLLIFLNTFSIQKLFSNNYSHMHEFIFIFLFFFLSTPNNRSRYKMFCNVCVCVLSLSTCDILSRYVLIFMEAFLGVSFYIFFFFSFFFLLPQFGNGVTISGIRTAWLLWNWMKGTTHTNQQFSQIHRNSFVSKAIRIVLVKCFLHIIRCVRACLGIYDVVGRRKKKKSLGEL